MRRRLRASDILVICTLLMAGGVLLAPLVRRILPRRPLTRDQVLEHVDHPAVLAACREIMADPQKYGPYHPSVGSFNLDLEASSTPKAVAALWPGYVVVVPGKCVQIEMAGGFDHYGFVAFPEGAEEKNGVEVPYHTRLINGLWYYTE